jgi:hypothetical protein
MGSKQKTTQTSHQVTTPTNPEWVESPLKNIMGRIDGLSNLDPYSLVAGSNPLLRQAESSAGTLGQPVNYGEASNIYRNVAQNAGAGGPASVLQNLQSYISPYAKNVVDSALADYDFGAGQTIANNQLAAARTGAFGGSGNAITKSLTADTLTRGRAATSSNLYDQAFNRGAALSEGDANRRQAYDLASQNLRLGAASGLADAAGAQDANTRANIGTQAQVGDVLRQIEQSRLSAPLELLRTQVGLTGGLPLNMFTGSTTDGNSTSVTKSSNPLGALGSLISLASIPLSGGTSLLGAGLGAKFK